MVIDERIHQCPCVCLYTHKQTQAGSTLSGAHPTT